MRGAKLFARLWFPLLYLFLVALTTGVFVIGPEFRVGWPRIFIGSLVGGLVVGLISLKLVPVLQAGR